jgi:hypothetical protein
MTGGMAQVVDHLRDPEFNPQYPESVCVRATCPTSG